MNGKLWLIMIVHFFSLALLRAKCTYLKLGCRDVKKSSMPSICDGFEDFLLYFLALFLSFIS